MNFANPTSLTVGMTGTLAGKQYRVAGRVVMGMDEAGETYYWNEFNLVNDEGESATLVYETAERGGQWRLFTLFEPEYPISAPDAAAKRVGDRLNLEGTEVRVTLVDESHVYHIEGQSPEGTEVGDVAHYFNAESGNTMQVVSWTGDEVECYRGVSLAHGVVASAFNLARESPASLPVAPFASFFNAGRAGESGGENYDSAKSFAFKAVGVVLVASIALVGYSLWANKYRSSGRKTPAPASLLAAGASGKLDGRDYRVRNHAVVEIAEVGRVFDRHEYQLIDMDDADALLILGMKPGAKDWVLFSPLQPLNPLTPAQAAALRMGETINLEGYVAPVEEIFQSVILRAGGEVLSDTKGASVSFGFVGRSGSTSLLVRWNHDGVAFYRGRTVSAQEVTTAFAKTARN